MRDEEKPLKSLALTTNSSLITALANDDGYETIFSRQVEALVESKDAIVGISTSGNSQSVLRGLASANNKGALTIGFTGSKKSQMDDLCKLILHAPSSVTGVIQQMHITFGQAICLAIENRIQP